MSSVLNSYKESLAAFWQQRDARERGMLVLAAAVIALALIYVVLIGPAMSGRAQLDKSLPSLRLQAAEMQVLAKQAAQFSGQSAARVPPASRESIEAALASKGLKAQNIVLSGDMIKVQLASASFAATLDWLDDMQKTARLTVQDTSFTALPQADTVSATLTLRQQKNEQEAE